MSIESKLEYLESTKQAIKAAIIAKGVQVADTDTFRSYATKISSITTSSGGGGGSITLSPQLTYEVVENAYYPGGNNTNVISYNNWDYTVPIDVSDTEYIALNMTTKPSYTYYDGTFTETGHFFYLNNKTFRIYKITDTNSIGFSNTSSSIATMIVYKVKALLVPPAPEIIIEEDTNETV